MKPLFAIFMLLALTAIVAADVISVTAPNKYSVVPGTTVYWDKNRFNDLHQADTLLFSKDRDFTTSGESTAVFLTGIGTAGFLTASVLDDSSVIITTSAVTDTNKSYWWQINLKK